MDRSVLMMRSRNYAPFDSNLFRSEKPFSRYERNSYGTSSFGGRLYSSGSLDRINTIDSSYKSVLNSRSPSNYKSRSSAWNLYDSSVYTNSSYGNSYTAPPRPAKKIYPHHIHSTRLNERPSGSDCSPTMQKRNMLMDTLNLNSNSSLSSSPKLSSFERALNRSSNLSAARKQWFDIRSNYNASDYYRPKIRERPILSSIGKSIKLKHDNNVKSTNESYSNNNNVDNLAEISRFKPVIKFRENNIGLNVNDRRSSITWELPEVKPDHEVLQSLVDKSLIVDDDKSITTLETDVLEPPKTIAKNSTCEETEPQIKSTTKQPLDVTVEINQITVNGFNNDRKEDAKKEVPKIKEPQPKKGILKKKAKSREVIIIAKTETEGM